MMDSQEDSLMKTQQNMEVAYIWVNTICGCIFLLAIPIVFEVMLSKGEI